jgi:tyrosyl-tRNA synthetase
MCGTFLPMVPSAVVVLDAFFGRRPRWVGWATDGPAPPPPPSPSPSLHDSSPAGSAFTASFSVLPQDIFYLKADICQLGMDQRKVNMLAREYADLCKPKRRKPIILSHPMLPGLLQGQEKMSKSDPNSAIFMEDTEQEVKTKIKKAFCPPCEEEGNPCLSYVKHIVLPWCGTFVVERKEENGGDRTFTDYESLVEEYKSGEVHPGDLKPSLSKAINSILQPVREHFENDAEAKALLKQVKSYKTTR